MAEEGEDGISCSSFFHFLYFFAQLKAAALIMKRGFFEKTYLLAPL